MSEQDLSLNQLVNEVRQKEDYLYLSKERWLIECPDSEQLKICSGQPCASTDSGSGFKCNKPIAVETEDCEIVPSLESTAEDCRNNTE